MVAVVRARMLDALMQHACVHVYIVHVVFISVRVYVHLAVRVRGFGAALMHQDRHRCRQAATPPRLVLFQVGTK